MRILFSGTPGYGHLLPLVPLARAFRQQGADVAVTTSESLSAFFAAEEMELLPAGPPLDVMLAELFERFGGPQEAEFGKPQPEVPSAVIAEFFAGIRVDRTFDQALTAARSWKPDLVVGEHYDFVGPLLAAELGVPAAVLDIAPPFGAEFDALTANVVSSRYADRGLTPSAPRWTFDMWPASLQAEGWVEPQPHFTLRPEAHRAAGWLPTAAVRAHQSRPTILVSFGTIHSAPEVIAPILRELAQQDVDIKATLGPSSRADFDLDADNVTFVGFTPLAELLQGVDVLVGAGGAGTTAGALAAGIPLVTVALAADQFLIAERVAAAGAGIVLPHFAGGPEAVTKAAFEILANAPYKAAAQRVAAEIAGLASPGDVASLLRTAVKG
jgi:UDP:flavonoid glycosyltransferase YjiC (YdhE family)